MITKKYLVCVSILYGFIVGAGFYGYSNDYYAEYYKSNLIYPYFYDRVGALLSTLTIFELHLGVYLTSFILSLSCGFLIKSFFEIKKINNILFFTFIFLLSLHVHPIIMSTSGAMRQGWLMSFLFFSVHMILSGRYKYSILFIFLGIFMHKSGLIVLAIHLITFLVFKLLKILKKKEVLILFLILFGILTYIFSVLSLSLFDFSVDDHRIVAGDFRYFWLFLNLSYILFYLFTFNNKLEPSIKYVCLFLYIHACTAPGILFMELNWQYERINMIIGILLIHVIGLFIKRSGFYLYLTLSMCIYLFLTIYQGMYSIGLT